MKRKKIIYLIAFFCFVFNIQQISAQINNFNSHFDAVKEKLTNLEIEEQNAVDIFMENRAGEERPARITSFGPLYYEAHNLAAAEDTNTTYLHPGGDSNLNLEGEGFEIGVFDAGHVLDTHVEFQNGNNRVVVGYDVGFEINYNWHGTHVGLSLIHI